MRSAGLLFAAAGWLVGACGEPDLKSHFQTDLLVKSQLPTAIDVFRSEFRRLPPWTTAELAGDRRWAGLSIAGNTTNECNECLLVALRHPDMPTQGLAGPFGNTDGDRWNRSPDGFQGGGANEVIDAWGNPIVYIPSSGYGQSVKVVRHDRKQVEVHAVKGRSGTHYNPDSYQLISLGEDGVQSDDDRENFTRVDE